MAWYFPNGPEPTSESWVPENADRSGGVAINGSEQIVSSGASRWRASLSFQLLREEVLWMRRLLLSLKGRSGVVYVGPFDMLGQPTAWDGTDLWAYEMLLSDTMNRDTPPKSLSGGVLAAAAALRANSVTISMSNGRAPFEGNYVQIGDRLYVLTDVDLVGGSTFQCGIEPLLRGPGAVGDNVVFDGPLCRMRLASPLPADALRVTGGDHVTNVTLDLVEAF